MQTTNRDIHAAHRHRPLRWYEWLLVLLLLTLANGARAASVYKCVGTDGSIAYQGLPCAQPQQTRVIELDAAPAYQASPRYAVERPLEQARGAAPRRQARYLRSDEPSSYECRAADGQVFYRHGACPHSIAAERVTTASSRRGGTRASAGTVAVSSRRVSRDEACAQIHAAGAIGRAGREHDEDVSTYERNLGRDPCR